MLYTSQLQTPLGLMYLASTKFGICMAEFVDTKNNIGAYLQKIATQLNIEITETKNVHLRLLENELEQYFITPVNFTVPLHTQGTAFQQSVWQQLQTIPLGKSITYKQQSIAMQNPLAIRAIATANGQNRIAIVIPCHRVLGTNGSLVGYAAGVHRKQWLLQHEGVLGKDLF
jgi:O-6-methylguanine DNA methyltransferase